jgi:hypothetical protein
VTHKFSKYLILAIGALGLSALPALADSQCNTGVALSTYLGTNFTCFIGDLDFSNFTYSSTASMPPSPIPSTAVTVNTVNNGNAGIGFNFEGSWTVGATGQYEDALIGFTVSVIGGGPAVLEDAALAQAGNFYGAGAAASVTENGCAGTSITACGAGSEWSLLTLQQTGVTDFSSNTFYSPTGQLTVTKNINASTQSGGSLATVTGVTDTFSQVPEPRSLALMLGFGLIAALGLKKKLQVQS